jgi:hypothetical protein
LPPSIRLGGVVGARGSSPCGTRGVRWIKSCTM